MSVVQFPTTPAAKLHYRSRKDLVSSIRTVLEMSDLLEDYGVSFLDENLNVNDDYTLREIREIALKALEQHVMGFPEATSVSAQSDANGLRVIDVVGFTDNEPPAKFQVTVEYPLSSLT